jgi:hypothetical protein
VAAALVLGSGSSAAVTALPAGSQIFGYQLAADAQGAATIVWSTSVVGDSSDSMIRVSQQNSQGKWSAPAVQLGALDQSLNPVLAESRSGAAVIAWSWVRGGPGQRTVVQAVTRSSPGSAWSAPQTIWSIGTAADALVTAGIDSAGRATIAWARYGPADPAIWSANIDTRNARATRPRKLVGAGAGGTDVTLAVNGAGAALLSWQRELGFTNHKNALATVHAAEMVSYRSASGEWLAPVRLSTFDYQQEPASSVIWGPSSPSSIVTANGTAATTWFTGTDGTGALEISARNRTTGRWSQAKALGGAGASYDAIATGPHGSLLALFSANDQGAFRTATSTDGIRWSTVKLPSSHDGFESFLASDPEGNDTITFAGPHSRILFTARTASDGWSAPKLAGRGFDPEAAVSTNGSITLAWEHGAGSHGTLDTRTYR